MSDRSETPSDEGGRDLRQVPRGWYVLVPAAALVIGILLGAFVVGVVSDDGQPEDASPEPTDTPTATAATGVVVPDACVDAADTVDQTVTTLRDGVDAVREFEADRIRALLDELEDLEARARRQAAACRRGVSITEIPSTPPGSPSPGGPSPPTTTTPPS